ncbi:MAG: preprotein translocase subunit YajC [Gammaproteobacteria bacterium]|nr:preprotein translocase subunit YajC [Gammaproteobacteria bacterium]
MGFFISDAYAQGAAPGQFPMGDIFFLLLMFAAIYFLLLRPQMKRTKEHKSMVDSLSKGDEAVTSGGLLGKITKVGDNFVTMEVADGLEVRVQKQSMATLMPKGTIKSL